MSALTDGHGHWRDRSIRDTNAAFEQWLRHATDLSGEWVAAGWDLQDAFVWQRVGFRPAEAGAWSSVIDDRQLVDPEDELEPEDWYSPIALVAGLAEDCARCGFTPDDYNPMTAVSTDPRQARDWVDAEFTLQDAAKWVHATLTTCVVSHARAWRSAGWNATRVADLEAALMHVIGHDDLFRAGGQAKLTEAAARWRDVGLEPHRTISCVHAGLSSYEAATMNWDETEVAAAIEALASLLTA